MNAVVPRVRGEWETVAMYDATLALLSAGEGSSSTGLVRVMAERSRRGLEGVRVTEGGVVVGGGGS